MRLALPKSTSVAESSIHIGVILEKPPPLPRIQWLLLRSVLIPACSRYLLTV